MTGFENIRSLSSFKSVRDDTVPRNTVGRILEAGRHAPSPGRAQTLEFIVVEDNENLEKLAQILGDHRVGEAPLGILVLSDQDRMERKLGQKSREFSYAEGSIAVQNMRIVAEEEGLSSLWKSGFDEHSVAQNFKVPDGKIPVSMVSIGYTDEPVRTEPPFGMGQVVYYDEYGHQVDSFFDNVEWRGLSEEKRIFSKKSESLIDKLKSKLGGVL